jgi:DNA-binding PadR family transcriptional regulator
MYKFVYEIIKIMNQHIKGSLNAIVLKLLVDNGRMYGYEITQKVKELTSDEIQITEGALYPLLHKLEAEEILTTKTEKVDGRVRKYYEITPKGNETAHIRISELAAFAENLNRILNPKLASI